MSHHNDDLRIPMPDGGEVVLHQVIGVPKREQIDPGRNVIRYLPDKRVLWTIQEAKHIQGSSRFAAYIGFEPMPDGALHVHASDGSVYRINVDTGAVTFLEWEK